MIGELVLNLEHRDRLKHTPESWEDANLEQFYPGVEAACLRPMISLISRVFEFAEIECGIAADMTASATRQLANPSKRMSQVHDEFRNAVKDLSLQDDWTIEKVKNGPDVDVKIRRSEKPLNDLLFEGGVEDNFEHILFTYAEELAAAQTLSNPDAILRGYTQDSQSLAWPIDEKKYLKVKKGRVPDGAGRRYCTIEIVENVHYEVSDLKGDAVTEFHMGYDPRTAEEDLQDRRSGSTVSDYMKLRVRLRGRGGELYKYKQDIAHIKARIRQPDKGNYDNLPNLLDPTPDIERILRELRAESDVPSTDVHTMEQLLLSAAEPRLWAQRRLRVEAALANNAHFFNKECKKNPRLASLLTAELMINAEVDPVWFIMTMANTGLLELIPYFKENGLEVSDYHEWLTSDPMTVQYVRNPETHDVRDKRRTPLYMRNMKFILQERRLFLEAWNNGANGGDRPTSGLMKFYRALEKMPGPTSTEALTEDIFLKSMLYYFNFTGGKLTVPNKKPSIKFHDIELNSYPDFFDYIVTQISRQLDYDQPDEVDKFFYAADALRKNIAVNQATFNIYSLAKHKPQITQGSNGAAFYSIDSSNVLERFFTSGLLTRIAPDRAMFTSPQVVTSIWTADNNNSSLKQAALEHLMYEASSAFDQFEKGDRQALGDLLSRTQGSKKMLLREVAEHTQLMSQFPTVAAGLYYEPPVRLLQDTIRYIFQNHARKHNVVWP